MRLPLLAGLFCAVHGFASWSTPAYEATISPIPSYVRDGGVHITGAVVVFRHMGNLYLKSSVDGMSGDCASSPSACGHHIHSGTNCSTAALQGGHLLTPDGVDPWSGQGLDVANATGTQDVWDAPVIAVGDGYDDIGFKPFVVHDVGGVRAACGILRPVTPRLYSAELAQIAGYAAGPAVGGSVQVLSTTFGMLVSGNLSGPTGTFSVPQTGGAGGLHVHSGSGCADNPAQGGHYWSSPSGSLPAGTAADPWNTHTYLAYGRSSDLVLDGSEAGTTFMFPALVGTGYTAVGGKPFVFHDADGYRAACGVLADLQVATAAMATYPGAEGSVDGLLEVALDASGSVKISGTVNGLTPDVGSAGIHVHDGFSCDDASYPGKHFTLGYGQPDPWAATTYSTDATGTATVSITSADARVQFKHVLGRVVVMHVGNARRACGRIQLKNSAATRERFVYANLARYPDYDTAFNGTTPPLHRGGLATLSRYPGYDNDEEYFLGTVRAWSRPAGGPDALTYAYDLEYVKEGSNGTISVQQARACPYSRLIPGCTTPGDCPSETVYPAGINVSYGAAAFGPALSTETASGRFELADGRTADAHASHAVVVLDSQNQTASCGTLKYAPMAQGFVMIEAEGTTVTLTANLAGLEREDGMVSSGGQIHIHSGCSCADAGNVSGHLFSYRTGLDPWTPGRQFYTVDPAWAASVPSASAKGISNIVSISVEGYTLDDIMGHVVVLHDSINGRIACGEIQCVGGACPTDCSPTPMPTPTPVAPAPGPPEQPTGGGGGGGGGDGDGGMSGGAIAAAVIVPLLAVGAAGVFAVWLRRGKPKWGLDLRKRIGV